MQKVSESWKNAHEQTLLNESYVEVSLDITDPDAMLDATAEDNGSIYVSGTTDVVSEIDYPTLPYGTLEQNIWLLDGKRKVIPKDDYMHGGLIGDVLSNEECVFLTKVPIITIKFSELHRNIIPGITIGWGTAYNEYATHFIITAYNGGRVIAEKEIIDNQSVTTEITMDIVDYDLITIRILEWCLPNHRARVDEIMLGWHKVYSKADLFSYSHQQRVDPISTSLPKMEIKFSIDNSDNSYNPYNVNGLSKYIMERQEVNVRYGLKVDNDTIEWIKGGVFYLSEWYAKQNGLSADFVARDLLEFMSDIYKDSISEITERSLYDLATQVLMAANLPLNDDGTVKWVVDESLKSIHTTAPIPEDTISNCLQLIANAGACAIYPDRNGILHIKPTNDTLTDYVINSFNSYSKPEITLSKPIKQVIVKVYNYTIGADGVSSTVTESVTNIGDTGGTITLDNPLITDEIWASVLGEWVANYYRHRGTLKVSGRADVRLDALDIVVNENDYGANLMRMTDVEFKFNGSFRGTGEGRVI